MDEDNYYRHIFAETEKDFKSLKSGNGKVILDKLQTLNEDGIINALDSLNLTCNKPYYQKKVTIIKQFMK